MPTKIDTPVEPKQLMILAKQGNAEAFTELYKVYFLPIYRFILSRVKNRQDAEDLVQIVFTKIYTSIQRYSDQGHSPSAYFFTVARNAITDYWRTKKTAEPIDEYLDNPSFAVSQDLEVIVETKETILTALQHLSPQEQDVLRCKFFEEFSTSDIAIRLQKSEQAVRQIQCRALKKLREYIVPYEPRI